MSESLARQNPQSPFRRAPSIVLHKQFSQSGGVCSTTEAEDLIKIAKDNIKNLKLKGKQVGTPRVQCKPHVCTDSTFGRGF